jgi:hypothetical protein
MSEIREPVDVERVLMDRARRHAERDGEPAERPVLPRIVGLAAALVVVVTVLFAFDRFLASMQRFLNLPVGDPEPAAGQAIPAYVVPDAGETSPTGTSGASITAPTLPEDTAALAPAEVEPPPPADSDRAAPAVAPR